MVVISGHSSIARVKHLLPSSSISPPSISLSCLLPLFLPPYLLLPSSSSLPSPSLPPLYLLPLFLLSPSPISSSSTPSLSPSLPSSSPPPPPQAYYMLDELLVGGEMQETSKRNIIRAVTAQDMLQEVRDLSSENIEQCAELLVYLKEI